MTVIIEGHAMLHVAGPLVSASTAMYDDSLSACARAALLPDSSQDFCVHPPNLHITVRNE